MRAFTIATHRELKSEANQIFNNFRLSEVESKRKRVWIDLFAKITVQYF